MVNQGKKMEDPEQQAITRIKELYQSLSDNGKDEIITELVESEEFMSRVLQILLQSEERVEDLPTEGGFIDFLRKVKE